MELRILGAHTAVTHLPGTVEAVENLRVKIGSVEAVAPYGAKIGDVIQQNCPTTASEGELVAAICNGNLISLSDRLEMDTKCIPVHTCSSTGFDIYRRSLSLALAAVCYTLFPERKLEVVISCSAGMSYKLSGNRLADEDWKKVVDMMREITACSSGNETCIEAGEAYINSAMEYFKATQREEVAELIDQMKTTHYRDNKVKVSTIDISHVKGANPERTKYSTLFIDPMIHTFNKENAKHFNNYEIMREKIDGRYSKLFTNYFLIALPQKETFAKPSICNDEKDGGDCEAKSFYNVIPVHLHESLIRDYKMTLPYKNEYLSSLNRTTNKLNQANVESAIGKIKNGAYKLPNPNYVNEDPNDKSFSVAHYTELYMRQQLADICALVTEKTKLILICGPSSSGKTTFSHRLAEAVSMHSKYPKIPAVLGMDMYYNNTVDCPILKEIPQEDGTKKIVRDFEHPDALRVSRINEHLKDLVDGKEVQMPLFNFSTGTYDDTAGKKLRLLGVGGNSANAISHDANGSVSYPLPPSGCIIMEGIHGLNTRFSQSVPDDEKLLIFIHPHSLLKIDPITPFRSTYDRLIRRSVRDARSRGYSLSTTVSRWPSVRDGEAKYIFSTAKNGNYIFNSMHELELPALTGIYNTTAQTKPQECFDDDEELAALQASLATNMSYITCMTPTCMNKEIPNDSILREFIGGLIFGEPH